MMGALLGSRWLLWGAPALLLAMVGIFVTGYLMGERRQEDRQAAADLIEERGITKLITARTEQIRQREGLARERITLLEIENAENQNRADAALAENRRIVRAAGGLRDPGRPNEVCRGAVPGNPGAAGGPSNAAAGGFLSEQLQEFLFTRFRDADRAAVYAQTGHKYALEMEAARKGAAAPAQ